MNKIKSFFEKIENLDISFWYTLAIFCFAISFRTLFENISTNNHWGKLNVFSNTYIQHPLWYITVFLGIACILTFFSKNSVKKVLNIVAIGSFIIILPPIIDLIYYRKRIIYDYLMNSWPEILYHYSTFFLYFKNIGIGIIIEIFLAMVGIFCYVYLKRKKIVPAFLASFFTYTSIFLLAIIPNITYQISSFFTKLPPASTENIWKFFTNVDSTNVFFSQRYYLTTVFLDNTNPGIALNAIFLSMSIMVLFFLLIYIVVLSIYNYGTRKVIFIFKNFRYLRILHYFILIFIGVMAGQGHINYFEPFSNLHDWLSFISAFLAMFFAGLFSIWENDIVDREIDTISNPDRPLVKRVFTPTEWHNMKWLFFIIAIITALMSGYSSLPTILLFIIIYHIYSCSPFRLKKYPIISSALVSLNGCVMFLMGYFLTAGKTPVSTVPGLTILGIFLFYVCVENIKNLKDIAGDKQEKILTIPVLLGDKLGKVITWILVIVGTLAVPTLIFPMKIIAWLAPIFGIFAGIFILRKNFVEKPLFLFYLIGWMFIVFW